MPQKKFYKKPSKGTIFSNVPLELDELIKYFRADIHIDLKVKGNGKVFCRIQLPNQHSNGRHVPLKMQKEDFEKEYSQFLYLEQIAAGEASSNLRRDLAETGYELFCKIFDEEQAVIIRRLQEEIGAEELAASDVLLGSTQTLKRIYVSADNLNIPWELLYTTPPTSEIDNQTTEIDPTLFLGYRFFIQQDFQDRTRLEHELKPFDKKRGVTVFVDKELEYTFGKEAPAIKKALELAGSDAKVFDPLDPFKPLERRGGQLSARNGARFGAALNEIKSDILHFACHSEQTDRGVLLRVSNDYYITEIEIRRSFPESEQGAFLFFNSCEMAVRAPAYYCQFLSYLAEKKYSGIIATEIKIKDADAFEFAEAVYKEFVSESVRSMHKAIIRARRKLLHSKGSFVGFTYSFYGNNDLIIGEY